MADFATILSKINTASQIVTAAEPALAEFSADHVTATQQLLQIAGAERHVTFTENDQLALFVQGFFKAAVYTTTVSGNFFGNHPRPGSQRNVKGLIAAVIVYNDHATDERV